MTSVPDLMANLEASLAAAKNRRRELEANRRRELEAPVADTAALEGSGGGSDAMVVGAQAADGDHRAAMPAPGDTLTVGQVLEALDGLPADMPVVLEVLGDVVWTAGMAILQDEVRIVGAEDQA
ncbi:MAG TPA: hypothetical protein VFJ85_02995 [Acidimicrobiales bacterium]|nr:hypothetical protein [Acidimicrobiales bacterium]